MKKPRGSSGRNGALTEGLTAYLRNAAGLIKSRCIYDFRPFRKRRMRRFYAAYLAPGSLGFDIGALTGSRSRAWLSLGARVVAVEPQPVFYRFLVRNLRRYSREKGSAGPGLPGAEIRRCTVLRAALGKERGQAVMKLSSTNPSVSSFSQEWRTLMSSIDPSIPWDGETRAEIVTLDDLIAVYGEPAFCKIDVEGLEADVLSGLTSPIPALSFEFFPGDPGKAPACIDLLEKLGDYRFNWSLVETFIYESGIWLTAEKMKEKLAGYTGARSGDVYAVLASNRRFFHR